MLKDHITAWRQEFEDEPVFHTLVALVLISITAFVWVTT